MVEKEKLKALVKEFAKAASMNGLAIKIADSTTGEIIPSKFELDKYLMVRKYENQTTRVLLYVR